MTKVKKNVIYQIIFQVISSLTPLITAPYISRILGAEKLGIYSYTNSIVSYFMLFAMLGISNYGSREIAISLLEGKRKVSESFWSVFCIQCITSLIMTVLYFVYVTYIVKANKIISLIQILYVLSCVVDINWFFIGIEKIKLMSIRGIVGKIITVICIFLFIKNESDLWKYVLIMSLSVFVCNVWLWRYLYREINVCLPSTKKVLNNIKPCMILFFPVLASSIYRIMDKTMVGNLSSYDQLGCYYNADKVINIPICIILGITTVLLPRMTSYFESGDCEQAKRLFAKAMDRVVCISCAFGFGIASVAEEFVPAFFGEDFLECVILIVYFSPVFIVKSISMCVRNVYLIPSKRDIVYNMAIICGVIANLIINTLLIPKYGAKGAVIATLITESIVCVVQIGGMGKTIRQYIFNKRLMLYVINGLIMSMILHCLKFDELQHVVVIFIKILLGGFVYLSLCYWQWRNVHFFGNNF